MGFEIVKAETRVASLITWFAGLQNRITDFVIGSKTRTKFEAIAVEMERQDFETHRLVRKAIPASIYNTFSFPLRSAIRAYGEVTFTSPSAAASAITIPAGSRVSTTATTTSTEKVYATLADAIIQIGGTTVTTAVICSVAGADGITGPGTVNQLKTTLSSPLTVTNTLQIGGGADVESEEARRIRFVNYISTLSRGTSAALIYGAKTVALTDSNGQTESVVSVAVGEPATSGAAGSCNVYIYNGSTGASAELIIECQKVIDGYYDNSTPVPGYKAAGDVITVTAADPQSTSCTVQISTRAGYDATTIETSATSAIETYYQSLGVGDWFVRNELAQRLMGIDGVYDLDLIAPAANVEVNYSQVVVQGTTSVTVSEFAG